MKQQEKQKQFVKPERPIRIELFNDHFQNYKRYQIPKAQLVIADIPYNVGKNAYGSNPTWYVGGITAMENQTRQTVHSLIQTDYSGFRNTCISAITC